MQRAVSSAPISRSGIAARRCNSPNTPRNPTKRPRAWAPACSNATSPSPRTASWCAGTPSATCTPRPTSSPSPSWPRNARRVSPRGSRQRQESLGEMLHQRHHACRIPAAARQDGRLQRRRDQCRRLHEGHGRWRTDLYATSGTLLTHAESIQLFKRLGTKFIPELKAPDVTMPYDGDYTQEKYAQQMIDEYKAAGIDPKAVIRAVVQPQRHSVLDQKRARLRRAGDLSRRPLRERPASTTPIRRAGSPA